MATLLMSLPAEVRQIIFQRALGHWEAKKVFVCQCDAEMCVRVPSGISAKTYQNQRRELAIRKHPLLEVSHQVRAECRQLLAVTLVFKLGACNCIASFLQQCTGRELNLVEQVMCRGTTRLVGGSLKQLVEEIQASKEGAARAKLTAIQRAIR